MDEGRGWLGGGGRKEARQHEMAERAGEAAGVGAPASAGLAQAEAPRAILAPVTSRQRELMARLAARLGVGLAADCMALAMDGDRLIATRPVYAGKLLAKMAWAKTPWLATL